MSYDYSILIGRMQPPHKAHIEIIQHALTISGTVLILLGSSNIARDIKNPWTWMEREEMIRACFPAEVQQRLLVFGVEDALSDQTWLSSIQHTVDANTQNNNICLVGHQKDETSFYIKMFPQWDFEDVGNIRDVHSTDLRTSMFENETINGLEIPVGIVNYLDAFMNGEIFLKLRDEFRFMEKYKSSWQHTPYPVTFVTVDSVVVCAGHVLLVRRKAEPGKNTWATPGGFLNQNERLFDAAIRELKEETGLKIPIPVLKGSLKSTLVVDDPNRSLRGRTLTHVFVFEIEPIDGKFPKVKGSDDAGKAKWISFSTIKQMQDQFFEDHFRIIQELTKGV